MTFGIKEITYIIVLSTNNYGIKLTRQTRPHKKYARNTEFNKVDFDKMFFGICLLAGSVKFAVIRDMFSNNPHGDKGINSLDSTCKEHDIAYELASLSQIVTIKGGILCFESKKKKKYIRLPRQNE